MTGTSHAATSAQIVLADPNFMDRNVLRDALVGTGFREVKVVDSLCQIEGFLWKRVADFVICDLAVPGGDILDFFRRVRHGKVGRNPFVILLATCESPSDEVVRAAIAAGADAVLRKPMIKERVIAYMFRLIQERRPFVVTSDYIGPDRRAPDRSRPEDGLFDVPNTLKAKMEGSYDPDAARDAIDAVNAQVNARKVRVNILRIGLLVQHVLTEYREKGSEAMVRQGFLDMIVLADETELRIRKMGHYASPEDERTLIACRGLKRASEMMLGDLEHAGERALRLLAETTAQMSGWAATTMDVNTP